MHLIRGVSALTHLFLLLILLTPTTRRALADPEVNSAVSERNRSYNRYYKALKETKDPVAKKALQKQIIDPSQQRLEQAIKKKEKSAIESEPLPTDYPERPDPGDGPELAAEEDEKLDVTTAASVTAKKTTIEGTKPKKEAVHQEPVVIDGADVPKVVEFPGKKPAHSP